MYTNLLRRLFSLFLNQKFQNNKSNERESFSIYTNWDFNV